MLLFLYNHYVLASGLRSSPMCKAGFISTAPSTFLWRSTTKLPIIFETDKKEGEKH